MKKIERFFLCTLTLLGPSINQAQEQWRFHLAFEDATGTRDTIWMVFDTAATVTGIDYELGENEVEMDTTNFYVWIHNWDWGHTKTIAVPFLMFPSHETQVFADNYEFPVILRWDTALFHAPGLPPPGYVTGAQMDCGHFFFNNNAPFDHVYNMLIDESVSVELMGENGWLFPLTVVFGIPLTVDIEDSPISNSSILYPNPTSGMLWIGEVKATFISIHDAIGREVMALSVPMDGTLDVSRLEAGIYLATIHSDQGTTAWRFIKK